MTVEKMSGLEIMQGMANGTFPMPSIAETMPMSVYSVESGKVVFEAEADERHTNPLGGVHGGFAATIMDSVTGCAIHTLLEPSVGYATIDLNIKMLKPVPKNKKLVAEGRVINLSKNLGISEGVLKDEAGSIYAHSTATCMILRK